MEKNDDQILSLMRAPSTMELGFKHLMDKYQEKVYWQIRRMVHSHDDANDIMQNTFIKVYRYFEKFEGKSSLFTWIYRIGTNETITFLNKQKKQRVDSLDEQLTSLGNLLVEDPFFNGNEAQIQLIKALETLPPKQKTVFNLRYHNEMTYKQISEVLETSEGALKASYHHAVKKIESFILNNHGYK